MRNQRKGKKPQRMSGFAPDNVIVRNPNNYHKLNVEAPKVSKKAEVSRGSEAI